MHNIVYLHHVITMLYFFMDKDMNYQRIAICLKTERKAAGLTQEEFAFRSGLSLHFIRNIEQGKPTNRLDKVNQALNMFGFELAPIPMDK